jgi:GTPase
MAKLRREIAHMGVARATMRKDRERNGVPSVAIAGYTNAGKSSLLNRLTGAGVLVDNALFATLDPTVRRVSTPGGRTFTLTDTVGFVRHLPHQLVEAFHSTLEEVSRSDLIVHVVDGANGDPEAQIAAVREVLAEIGAGDLQEIIAINKADIADPDVVARVQRREPHSVVVSARTGEGLDKLLAVIERDLPRPDVKVTALVPYEKGKLVARIHDEGEVDTVEHLPSGTLVRARVHAALAAELKQYVPADAP